jgi:serine/threonine protein kinase
MGVVYKAEDTKLKRKVALKFLLPHILSSDEEKTRFVHEAQAAASLHHPNICTIYEINEADGQTFISMAYLEGESLNDLISRGPLKPTVALRIALQVARGLAAAHENGIIHRDIKSSNIMVSEDGRATIMDFGIAKSIHQTHATRHGTKLGTIGYMSPEQTRGDRVDHRTDIWSLGVLLYELIAGQRPFRGDYDEAVIYSIMNEDPEPLVRIAPDEPPEIWLAIQRAIAKKPDDRYQSAAEMIEDLEAL